jgi:hypothetical protein
VKIALTILCSLLLMLGQTMAAPVASAADCGCGGKSACCKQAQVPTAPPAATVPASSQIQMVSPVPAVVVWSLAAAGTFSISPTVSPSLTAGVAPIFARNCSRLI